MKKVIIAVMALIFNMFLFSCSKDSVAETETLYDIQATEGDDETTKDNPSGNG